MTIPAGPAPTMATRFLGHEEEEEEKEEKATLSSGSSKSKSIRR